MPILVDEKDLRLTQLSLGPYGTNTYIVTCAATGESAVVDAPGEAARVLEALAGTTPRLLLMTHAHMDHTGALAELKAALKVPMAAHPLEAPGLHPGPDQLLTGGETLSLGRLTLTVLHTPGHTPGSLCFLTGRHLLAGDTLFPDGPGHTRSPAAFGEIVGAITQNLFALPDETGVYPGHGGTTTIGREKTNYARFLARPRDPGLCGDVLWVPA
jgi:glyoxylase-like metal-dependent hydrolase (beta-lactamase superfamily II)